MFFEKVWYVYEDNMTFKRTENRSNNYHKYLPKVTMNDPSPRPSSAQKLSCNIIYNPLSSFCENETQGVAVMIRLKLKAKNHNMPGPYLSITRPHSRFHGVENDWFIDDLIVSNFSLVPHLYQLIK